MAKLPLVYLPDPVLRQVSTPIETVDASVRKLADDMLETMYAKRGLGLAGVQVGVTKRILVLDLVDEEEPKHPIVMINPEIVRLGDDRRTHEEGCLSMPDIRTEIERPGSLTVTYTDRDGQRRTLNAEGLLATAIQHEIDHLDGRLIIDFMSRLRREMVIRKFKKIARTTEVET